MYVHLQIFVGIVLILAPCSPSYVWNRLTVHWLFLSPANAAVLYVFGGSIRLRHGVTPLLMASYTFLGGLFGSTLGMVLSYLIYFINGRSFETTTTKVQAAAASRNGTVICVQGVAWSHASPSSTSSHPFPLSEQAVTSMIFAPLATFLLCCERFKRRDQETLGRYAVLGVALQIVGSYGNTSATPLRYFTAQLYNLAIASTALLLTRTLVAPVTTGEFCRRSMANALEQLGVCVRATIDAMAANKEALGPDGEPAPAALAEADLKVVHTAATAVAKGLTVGLLDWAGREGGACSVGVAAPWPIPSYMSSALDHQSCASCLKSVLSCGQHTAPLLLPFNSWCGTTSLTPPASQSFTGHSGGFPWRGTTSWLC